MSARLFNQIQYAVKYDLLTYQYQAVPTQKSAPFESVETSGFDCCTVCLYIVAFIVRYDILLSQTL